MKTKQRADIIIKWIDNYCNSTSFEPKSLVVGVSGGIDSSVVSTLCALTKRRTIIFRYALKVAILPTITLIGVGFGALLSGTVFAEIIFSRPGIGKIIYNMVLARNFPVIQGAVLITIGMYVVVTLISDLLVSLLDPRVRDTL